MELEEQRRAQLERKTAFGGTVTGLLAGADYASPEKLWLTESICESTIGTILPMPWDGAWTVIAASVAAIGAAAYSRYDRRDANREEYERRVNLRRAEWTQPGRKSAAGGMRHARSRAAGARADLPWHQRWRAPASAVGIPVGKTISGARSRDRGRQLVVPWEEGGLMIMGTQGTRKSTILAGQIADIPGPLIAVSTKDELVRMCHRATSRKGHNYALNGTGQAAALPDGVRPFRYSLLSGCRDSSRAQALAQAMVEAANVGAGTQDSDTWKESARSLITGLLQAAAWSGKRLAMVERWINQEDWAEPRRILEETRAERADSTITESTITGLEMMESPNMAKPAGSAAFTARLCFGFLQNETLAQQFDASPEEAVDLREFMTGTATLYVMSGDEIPLSAPIAALWNDMLAAAGHVARNNGHKENRLSPPLVLAVDECDVTLPGVDLSNVVSKRRGDPGVFTIAVTQNRARMIAQMGKERFEAYLATFPAQLILRIDGVDDVEYYERRSRTRTRRDLTESTSEPNEMRMLPNWTRRGHSKSHGETPREVPLWNKNMWSTLRTLQGVLFIAGEMAVVQCPNGREVATKLGEKADAAYVTREWAEAHREEQSEQADEAARISEETRAWHQQVQAHRQQQREL